MFVGEMGCFLVLGLINLYRRFVSKRTSDSIAYQPIATNEDERDDDAASIHSQTALNGSARKANPELRGWKVCLLALPSSCDLLGTTLMNIGLLLVAASIYQMTRGALVLFVGLFSVTFLRRKLHLFQWLSLFGVMLGVAVVGLAGAIQPDQKIPAIKPDGEESDEGTSAAARVIIGVVMIAGAQIFTATQFVVEEYLLERYAINPIQVVGWEGVFGFSVTFLAMVILHLFVGRTEAGHLGVFDMVEGWRQFWEHRAVFFSSILIMISIG